MGYLMKIFQRALGWGGLTLAVVLVARDLAGKDGLVLSMVFVATLGAAVSAACLMIRALSRVEHFRRRREFCQYLPGPDGRIAPRSDRGVSDLAVQLGVGARDRFTLVGRSRRVATPAARKAPAAAQRRAA